VWIRTRGSNSTIFFFISLIFAHKLESLYDSLLELREKWLFDEIMRMYPFERDMFLRMLTEKKKQERERMEQQMSQFQ